MELSPILYHRIIRPRWVTNLYIGNIIKNTIDISQKSVLDFGCGTGANCCLFNPSYYLGIDPDEGRIRYAQKTYPNYRFQIMKELHHSIPSQSVNYILVISVLHHIQPSKLPYYLQEFRRILQPGGSVLVIEPCLLPHNRLNNCFMRLFDRGKFIQSPNDYMKAFLDSQFDIYMVKEYKQLFLYNKIFFAAKPV